MSAPQSELLVLSFPTCPSTAHAVTASMGKATFMSPRPLQRPLLLWSLSVSSPHGGWCERYAVQAGWSLPTAARLPRLPAECTDFSVTLKPPSELPPQYLLRLSLPIRLTLMLPRPHSFPQDIQHALFLRAFAQEECSSAGCIPSLPSGFSTAVTSERPSLAICLK